MLRKKGKLDERETKNRKKNGTKRKADFRDDEEDYWVNFSSNPSQKRIKLRSLFCDSFFCLICNADDTVEQATEEKKNE